MAFCRRCGRELGEGDVFCPDCGTPAGAAGGPTYVAPRKRTSPMTVLLIMAVAFLALTFFLFPAPTPADYKVTITVEEFALCNTDRTVDNDPADNHAEILFKFSYGGATKYFPGPGDSDYVEGVPVGAPGGDAWKTGAGLVKRPAGDPVEFKVHGTGSIQVSMFMLDYDGDSTEFGMTVHDTVDVFDAEAGDVDRPGVSGLFFSVDLTEGRKTQIFQGDDLPMGYVKLSVEVEKL